MVYEFADDAGHYRRVTLTMVEPQGGFAMLGALQVGASFIVIYKRNNPSINYPELYLQSIAQHGVSNGTLFLNQRHTS